MVSMLASDRVRPKTRKLVFAAESKSKDWFALNQDNVSEWSDTSSHGLLFQLASTKGKTIHCMYRNHDYFGDGLVHDTWRLLAIQTI